MGFVRATWRKDLRRSLRDWPALLLWIGIPFIVGTLMNLLSGGRDGPSPQAQVLVADLDDSFLSGLLVGALSQDAAGGFIQAESVTEEDGRARMDEGGADALIVIPEGFGQAALEDTPTTLELVKNPSRIILPGIVEEGVTVLVDGAFYAQRILGDEVRPLFEEQPPDSSGATDLLVSAVSVRINRVMNRLTDRIFPPVLQVETGPPPDAAPTEEEEAEEEGAAEEDDESPVLALLFLPGLIFMSLLFISQGIAIDLWNEREMGTLRRIVTTPRPAAEFLLGKLLNGVGLVGGIGAIVLVVAYPFFGLSLGTYPIAVVWCALAGAMLILLLMVVNLHASSARVAGIFGTVIIFPLMMLGGSFFPFEAMPDGLVRIGSLTPNGWALMRFKEILADDIVWKTLGTSLVALVAVCAVLFFWTTRRLGVFARG